SCEPQSPRNIRTLKNKPLKSSHWLVALGVKRFENCTGDFFLLMQVGCTSALMVVSDGMAVWRRKGFAITISSNVRLATDLQAFRHYTRRHLQCAPKVSPRMVTKRLQINTGEQINSRLINYQQAFSDLHKQALKKQLPYARITPKDFVSAVHTDGSELDNAPLIAFSAVICLLHDLINLRVLHSCDRTGQSPRRLAPGLKWGVAVGVVVTLIVFLTVSYTIQVFRVCDRCYHECPIVGFGADLRKCITNNLKCTPHSDVVMDRYREKRFVTMREDIITISQLPFDDVSSYGDETFADHLASARKRQQPPSSRTNELKHGLWSEQSIIK
ncbi:hypothetical protein CLF_110370, partial [Clonorchis sinensis]